MNNLLLMVLYVMLLSNRRKYKYREEGVDTRNFFEKANLLHNEYLDSLMKLFI